MSADGWSKVDKEAAAQIESKITGEMTERFPGVAVKRVAVLLYGDDPVVEPGEVVIRIILDAPDGKEERKQAVEAFHDGHREAFRKFRDDLAASVPDARVMEILTEGEGADHGPFMRLRLQPPGPLGERPFAPGELTPVMARLGPADLETLDTLITSGIAPNRAEAVRWVLARIRERPAYGQLRERAQAIEELKAQF
jgi:hypothetical protein